MLGDLVFLSKLQRFLSLIAFFIYPLFNISYTQLGESLFVKLVKLWLTFQAYICYLLLLINIAGDYTIERILKPFFLGICWINNNITDRILPISFCIYVSPYINL